MTPTERIRTPHMQYLRVFLSLQSSRDFRDTDVRTITEDYQQLGFDIRFVF